MSRYELPARKPGAMVVVGWDHPLLTYFVHVHHPESREDGPSIWLGGTARELYDLDDLERAVRPYADLSIGLAGQLYRDRDEGR